MSRVWHGAGAALALLSLAVVSPAAAQWQALETSIDLNYTYEQQHEGSDVLATTGLQQKYQLRLSTTLSSSYDFLGALSVDLDDKWALDAATTSKVSPTLELGFKGPQSGIKFSYSGVRNRTDEFEDAAGSTQYSNNADLDVEITPYYWPELKFRLQERRDYEAGLTDTSGRVIELQLRDEFYDVLRLEFSLKLDKTIETLPTEKVDDATDWSLKATYKEVFFRDVDFELAYEVKESYSESETRGVFTGSDESYTQSLKTRMKKSLELSPRSSLALVWEYNFDQDLLALDYDYKVQNKYGAALRFDVLPTLKIAGEWTRDTEKEVAEAGGDDTSKVADSLKAAFDYEPVSWLRLGGKAERKLERSVDENTGGSVDKVEDRQYELTLKHKWRDFWDFSAGTSATWSYAEGVIQDREAKFKADLKLKLLDLTWTDMALSPTYESSRSSSWDELGTKTNDSSTSDARLRFEARALLFQYIKVTFSHEYGQKLTEELDEVLNYSRELTFNENTRLNVAIDEIVQGLRLEGEIERKASDTEDDTEPQLVEVSYALKLDWEYEELQLSSAFKYSDKGEEDDDTLDFAAKVGWQWERLDLMGDYQFTKTYSELTDESRKLNLKLSYKF